MWTQAYNPQCLTLTPLVKQYCYWPCSHKVGCRHWGQHCRQGYKGKADSWGIHSNQRRNLCRMALQSQACRCSPLGSVESFNMRKDVAGLQHNHTCTHTHCMHAHPHTHTHACMYTCMHTHTHTRMHVHMHAHPHTHNLSLTHAHPHSFSLKESNTYTHSVTNTHKHTCPYKVLWYYMYTEVRQGFFVVGDPPPPPLPPQAIKPRQHPNSPVPHQCGCHLEHTARWR